MRGSIKLNKEGRTTFTPLFQWTRFDRPAGGGIVISPSTSLATNDQVDGPIHEEDLSPLDVNLSSGGGIDETLQMGFELRAIPESLRIPVVFTLSAAPPDRGDR